MAGRTVICALNALEWTLRSGRPSLFFLKVQTMVLTPCDDCVVKHAAGHYMVTLSIILQDD
jgi:hypothetical protein